MRRNIGRKKLASLGRDIKLLILDVDGVLTDGSIILDAEDNELKAFNVRDGHGIKMLQGAGIDVAIITGRYSKVVKRRAKELGIKEVHQRCYIKIAAFKRILKKFGVSEKEAAYIGDDIVDIPLLRRAGLSVAVSDAADEAKANAIMITKHRGGKGAVREVIDFLLKSKGILDEIIREYSQT